MAERPSYQIRPVCECCLFEMSSFPHQCIICCSEAQPGKRYGFNDKIWFFQCISDIYKANLDELTKWAKPFGENSLFICKNCYYVLQRWRNARAKTISVAAEITNTGRREQKKSLIERFLEHQQNLPDLSLPTITSCKKRKQRERTPSPNPSCAPYRKRVRLQLFKSTEREKQRPECQKKTCTTSKVSSGMVKVQ